MMRFLRKTEGKTRRNVKNQKPSENRTNNQGVWKKLKSESKKNLDTGNKQGIREERYIRDSIKDVIQDTEV